ncbi:MAG TPA: hypothetical protein PKE39_03985 [Ignavibacteria bacterium]|nr:hypothetical protein [Ignavibacteria bacterium]HMQ98161.1 hypothetical protein [Ignavibacteria bacterium]
MFKFFKNVGNSNKVWGLLNSRYFNTLGGKIGNTVLKIKEESGAGSRLIIQTDNENVKAILQKEESNIINDIHAELGILITGITIT